MKKFLNNPNDIMNETIRGYVDSNQKRLSLPENSRNIIRKNPKQKGKVKLVVGNGGGHEPGLMGWVGYGMFDLDCLGNIFTAQSGKVFFEGIKSMYDDSPVLLTIANHDGDVVNGNIAFSMCKKDGMEVEKVVFYDDVASAPKGEEEERRGMAGMMFAIKCAGAMAEENASLSECLRIFEKARDNVRTIALAMTSCTHPVTGLVMMETPDDEVNIGAGVHGEGGSGNVKFTTGYELMKIAGERLIEDMPFVAGDEVCVLINGMGSTSMMELSIAYQDICKILDTKGIKVYDGVTGNFVTTQEMGGLSLSFMKVDDELKKCWDAPCSTPAYTNM